MTIKVKITIIGAGKIMPFYRLDTGQCVEVEGLEVPYSAITVGDLTDRIAETEAHLSRILGLTVKIETAGE